MIKTKQDNNVTNRIGLVYEKPKLNYQDLSDRVQSVMKTRQDNNITDCTSVVNTENETKLS